MDQTNMEVTVIVNDTRVNPGDPIRIEGYVTYEGAESPAAGAKVTLLNSSMTTMTDSNGFFSFGLNAEPTVGNWTYVIAHAQTEISDDKQSDFWQADAWGNGNLSMPSLNDNSTMKQRGNDSLEISVGEGRYAYWKIYHRYATKQDWANQDVLSFYWYGQNTGEPLILDVYAPDVYTGFFETLITEDFSGWKNLVIPLDSFKAYNSPSWSNVTEIGIGWLKSQGTRYIDDVNLALLKSVSVVTDQLIVDILVEDPRINVNENATICASATREFDGSIFDGVLTLNDTIYQQNFVGKRGYRVASASGGRYGITRIGANNIETVVWDRINATLSVPEPRVGAGTNAEITVEAVYEYDNSTYDGIIALNNSLTQNKIGKHFYSIQSLVGGGCNITAFKSNIVCIVFDEIEAKAHIETQALGRVEVIVTLRYVYDGKPVENAFVKIHDPFRSVNATHIENGMYKATLETWSPSISIGVQKSSFKELELRIWVATSISTIILSIALGIAATAVPLACMHAKRMRNSR